MRANNIKFNFNSSNFVLTGAGKGIGLSTLKKLFFSGARVAFITKSYSDIVQINRKYKSERILSFCGDISDENDRNLFVRLIKKKMKKIDGLINNAGIRQRKSFNDISTKEIDLIFEVNLKSIFFLIQNLLENFNKKNSSIVNIASIVGPNGFADLSGYALTKSGLIGLTKSLSIELAKKKIRVNSISPGFVKSSYEKNFKKKLSKFYKYTLQRTPLGRWGECDEVADLILFLLSNNSNYITGNNIFIDGGWSSN